MSTASENEAKLRDYLRKATASLTEERGRVRALTEKLAALESRFRSDPVAIIGMGCRWPGGVESPEDLWRMLLEEREGLSPFPTDRGWTVRHDPRPGIPGSCSVTEGGFLADAAGFDAPFFGYSAQEAAGTDPQQRLLLETAWEALERAGIAPLSLNGSATGVFVGLTPQGYAGSGASRERPEEGTDFLAVGTLPSAASGRISYFLGLHGPALTVDTACSSALSALHLATRALLSGECTLALAAGVTVIAAPDVFLEHSRFATLAGDGRTKPFSADADGGNWAEGAGVVVLERLADAERLGHPVLAVIRGSAVGQNGMSNGLAVPSGQGQRRVMRGALDDAGLTAHDIDFVETHGTGTPLGDAMEAEAMIEVYGEGRSAERPLLFGSIKSNFGHTQSAAGMAGVMKAVLAIGQGTVPASLAAEPPSESVLRSRGTLRPVPAAVPWPATGRPRRAAVTALGAGGTNGHVILEQHTGTAAMPRRSDEPGSGSGSGSGSADDRSRTAPAWVVSAKDPEALRRQAGRLFALLAGDSPGREPGLGSDMSSAMGSAFQIADVAYSLAVTRSAFSHRAAVSGDSREARLDALRALAAGGQAPGLITGVAGSGKTLLRVVGVGTAVGATAAGVAVPWGRPSFEQALSELDKSLSPHLTLPLRDLIEQGPHTWTTLAEPQADLVSFALAVAVARLWRTCGVRPTVVADEDSPSCQWAAEHIRGACPLDTAVDGIVARRSPKGRESEDRIAASPVGIGLDAVPFDDHVATAFVGGVRLDWDGVFAGLDVRRVPLPTYAFQRRRYWQT